MKEQEKAQLRASLIEAIEAWWEIEAANNSLPWVGDNTLAYMADAVLIVIFGLQDTQEYLEREHDLSSD